MSENSVTCVAGYVEGPALTCIADVCGGTIADANAHSTATLQTVTQNWARSATAGTCTWDCNSGYLWDSASSSCKANCAASTQTVNGRSYSVPAFNHGATASANSSSAVLGGNQAYSQNFSCTNGVVATNGSETAGAVTCSTNFVLNGAQCLANSCLTLKNAGISTSGTYVIDTDGAGAISPISVTCDMATDGGGYTFYPVNSGLVTSKYTDNDSCKAVGLHIFVPRTQAHLNKALTDYNGYVINSTVGIYGLAAGSYTAYPMNS